eukprot:scaffold2486_cov169-Ochromonas_danica.AAC.8
MLTRTLELRKTRRLGPPKQYQVVKPGDLSGLIRVSGLVAAPIEEGDNEEEELPTTSSNLPPFEPLVLWQDVNDPENKIEVIPELACKLRPHQREGVQFLFECTMGLRGFDGEGCILADDMGLGKTLMSITLLWTLLNQGFRKGESAVRKVVVACPTSLVGNWDNEIRKWVGDRCPTFAVKSDPKKMIKTYLQHRGKGVLIISYETQRLYSKMFENTLKPLHNNIGGNCCDLLICDEAHKLKNAESGLAKSLTLLPARKRILLSGTPMQNELTEFFNMVNFCNPNVLGTLSEFRKRYERPILAAREPDALESEISEANKLQKELSTIVNEFILKRGNILNAQHLPPKLVQFVCCRPTPLQLQLYETLLNSKEIRHIQEGKQTNTLNCIHYLSLICFDCNSHPKLVLDTYNRKIASNEPIDDDLRALVQALPPEKTSGHGMSSIAPKRPHDTKSGKPPSGQHNNSGLSGYVDPEQSGKMFTLFKMMQTMRILKPSERIVIVSNYTQTLDLIEFLCKQANWPFLRLDGTVSSTKRTKLVDEFNNPLSNSFAFLLSSKAGGCGINLIGANRLVLFDPDWNPASDKQAAGRIWREGQKRRCFIYRFMSTGTIEEKIIQRQLSKEGLADIVDDKEQVNCISTEELKQLFTIRAQETHSDTHDTLKCKRCTHMVNNKATKASKTKTLNSAQIEACLAFLEKFEENTLMESLSYQRREIKRALENGTGNLTEATLTNVLPFHDQIDKLKMLLQDQTFANLTAYSRKQREVFMAIEEQLQDARKNKLLPSNGSSLNNSNKENADGVPEETVEKIDCTLAEIFAPSFSIYSELIKQWTDLVPNLVSLVGVEEDASDKMDVCPDCNESGANRDSNSSGPSATFVEQVGCPEDTDINNWSHHCSVLTCDDDLLCSAFGDTEDAYISFVFGLEVNFSLLELREAQNREEVERKKAEQQQALLELNRRRQRLREGKPAESDQEGEGELDSASSVSEGRCDTSRKGKGGKKRKKQSDLSDVISLNDVNETEDEEVDELGGFLDALDRVDNRLIHKEAIIPDSPKQSVEAERKKNRAVKKSKHTTEDIAMNVEQPSCPDPNEGLIEEVIFKMMTEPDLFLHDDLIHMTKLQKKGKLDLSNFQALWKMMKKHNNNWRLVSAYNDTMDIFTRTAGLKATNYCSFTRLQDYFVGEQELLKFIFHQAMVRNLDTIADELQILISRYEHQCQNKSSAPSQTNTAFSSGVEDVVKPHDTTHTRIKKIPKKNKIFSDDEDEDEAPVVVESKIQKRRQVFASDDEDEDDHVVSNYKSPEDERPSAFDSLRKATTSVPILARSPEEVVYTYSQDEYFEEPDAGSFGNAAVDHHKDTQDTNMQDSQQSESNVRKMWVCAVCTLHNPRNKRKCVACG